MSVSRNQQKRHYNTRKNEIATTSNSTRKVKDNDQSEELYCDRALAGRMIRPCESTRVVSQTLSVDDRQRETIWKDWERKVTNLINITITPPPPPPLPKR